MILDDARNVAIVVGTLVTTGMLLKAVVEYSRQNAQRRAEYYLRLREKLKEGEQFKELLEWLVDDNPKLAQLPWHVKAGFLGFYEDVALLVNAGLLMRPVAHYMFAYYAVRCWESNHFWQGPGLERDAPYWRLFRQFVAQMKEVETSFLSRPDSVTSRLDL